MLAGACIAAYLPGLFGGFLFDDYQNIVENAALQSAGTSFDSWLAAALSSNAGHLMRPISMLSFAANDYAFGLNAIAFKAVNLAIHLANGLLVYVLCRRILPLLTNEAESMPPGPAASWISLIVAGVWLLHPLNVSSVLYVVQRMNQLSTLFMLLGLIAYVAGRSRAMQQKPGLLVGLTLTTLCAALATFSKENGALLFAYALVIEGLCFRFSGLTKGERWAVGAFFFAFLLLPLLLLLTRIALEPDWLLAMYEVREFTLSERLLTQPRILLHYVLWILIPLPSFMGIYHDDIPISTALLTPWTTLPAALIVLLAPPVALCLRQRYRHIAFALLWFAAGHSMESTIIPLEQVFEHRNYMPMLGLIIGVTLAVRLATRRHHLQFRWALSLGSLGVLASLTYVHAYAWGDPLRLAVQAAADHPNSPRSQYDAGRMIYMNALAADREAVADSRSTAHFLQAMALSETYVHPAVSLILTAHRNEQVPQDLIENLIQRIRKARLLQPTPILLLIDAVSNGSVLMEPEAVESIFEAAMDNPRLSNSARAMMLNNYGRYAFTVLRDHQSAVSLTLAAAGQDPMNPLFQVNLAKLAIALGQPAIAQSHLHNAKGMDVTLIYQEEIAHLQSQLSLAPAALVPTTP